MSDDLPSLDSLMPVLRPVTPLGAGSRIHRRLVPSDPDSPFLVFFGRPASATSPDLFVSPGHLVEFGIDESTLEATCLQNWLRCYDRLDWKTTQVPGTEQELILLDGDDPLVGSLLLQRNYLEALHRHFRQEVIYVGMPDAFRLLVHTEIEPIVPILETYFSQGLSYDEGYDPILFRSVDGVISGYQMHEVSTTDRV